MEPLSPRSHNGTIPGPLSPLECLRSRREFTLPPRSVTGEFLHCSCADFGRDGSRLDSLYANPDTEAQVNFPVTTATTGGARGAGTVLGKRARERYGTFRKTPYRLMITAAAALSHPKRSEGRAQVGSWRRQGGPRGFTIRQPPGPKK